MDEMIPAGSSRRRVILAVLLVILALLAPVGVLLRMAADAMGGGTVPQYAVILLQEGLLWLLPACFFRPWRYQRMGEKRNVLPAAVLALPAGAAIQLFASQLRVTFPFLNGPEQTLAMPTTAPEWVLAVLALAIVPAVCEEAFFRGSLTTHLLDVLRPVPAYVCAVLLFALMHGSAAGLPAHIMVSACCVLLMMATGRILAPILLHASFNLTALAVPYLPQSPWLLLAGLVPSALVVWLGMRIEWRAGEEKSIDRTDLTMLVLLLAFMLWRYL